MDTPFRLKLRLIYFPFVLFSAGMVCAYSLLNWLFFNGFHLFRVKAEVIELWIPLALPWIPLFIWYRKRINLLKFRDTGRDPATGILLLAGVTIIAPLCIAQAYLATAAGKLTRLKNVSEITQVKDTRYYMISNYAVDRDYHASHINWTTSGKSNQYLNLTLYIVCPLYDSGGAPGYDMKHYPANAISPLYFIDGILADSSQVRLIPPDKIASVDVLKGANALSLYGLAGKNGVVLLKTSRKKSNNISNAGGGLPDSLPVSPDAREDTKIGALMPSAGIYPLAWVGEKYKKQISNRLDNEEKNRAIDEFARESWLDYVQAPRAGFTYFDEIPYNDDFAEYEKIIRRNERFFKDRPVRLLEPHLKGFEKRNGNKFAWVLGSFAIGASIYLFILSFIPLDDRKVAAWLAGHPLKEEKNDLREMGELFLPRKGFTVTPVIVYLNLAVFLCMVFAGLGFIDFSPKDLVAWGGNFGPYTSDGQWWRLLTGTFLHAGLMHLLLNMYALVFAGLLLEPKLGTSRFAICYLVTGVLASLASYFFHHDSVAIGASGAIFGMYGILLAFLLNGIFPAVMKKAFLTSILIFVGFNLVMGLAGNIDNAAHIGGLVSGFLIGLLFGKKVNSEEKSIS